jgi:hypothetical protein
MRPPPDPPVPAAAPPAPVELEDAIPPAPPLAVVWPEVVPVGVPGSDPQPWMRMSESEERARRGVRRR